MDDSYLLEAAYANSPFPPAAQRNGNPGSATGCTLPTVRPTTSADKGGAGSTGSSTPTGSVQVAVSAAVVAAGGHAAAAAASVLAAADAAAAVAGYALDVVFGPEDGGNGGGNTPAAAVNTKDGAGAEVDAGDLGRGGNGPPRATEDTSGSADGRAESSFVGNTQLDEGAFGMGAESGTGMGKGDGGGGRPSRWGGPSPRPAST
eukprot:TRINITY_DN15984_c0_g1_i1.p1 TRINITY_DN15984_c0_g1~~TRINITY_DN15984_c0_g1_i1.p1  ORF type:complete len:204 (+),score=52.98 TRINITY_DN15984_c0_g1_i1:460-1071(+)